VPQGSGRKIELRTPRDCGSTRSVVEPSRGWGIRMVDGPLTATVRAKSPQRCTNHPGALSHVAAFEFFGRCPRRLGGHLKTGVTRTDSMTRSFNQPLRAGAQFGCLIRPAREGKPKTNRAWSARCSTFGTRSGGAGSQAQQMQVPRQWCGSWVGRDAKILGPGTAEPPGFVFSPSRAKHAMRRCRALSSSVRGYSGKVATDCHVKVGQALYSVPWRLMGCQQRHARPACDRRADRARRVLWPHVTITAGGPPTFEHYPPEKIAHDAHPHLCRRGAAEVGPACSQVRRVHEIQRHSHRLAQRLKGVLAFRKTVGDRTRGCLRAGKRVAIQGLPHHQASSPPAPTRRHHRTAPTQAAAHLRGPLPSHAPRLLSRVNPPPYPIALPTTIRTLVRNHQHEHPRPGTTKRARTSKLTGMPRPSMPGWPRPRRTLGHIDFLRVICEDEIAPPRTAALTRRIAEPVRGQSNFESFDFTAKHQTARAIWLLAARAGSDDAESVILTDRRPVGKNP